MFKIKLENSRILRGIVEALSSIIDETEFIITTKELSIRAMDPSRICLLQLSMIKEDFDEYECNEDIKIGLNLEDLDKILKRSSATDSVELTYEPKAQKIKIKMKQRDTTKTRTFSLALLDIEMEDIPMENLLKIEYDADWSMDPAFFVEAIKDAEIYSEILNIIADEEKGLIFSSIGQIGEMEYELALDEILEAEIKGTNKGAYSLQFLKSILKIENITEKLTVSLKDDHPLKLIFNILEGGTLSYFLAPRVEEVEFEEEDLEEY
jgi:proliferating cell nuclear antigen